MRFYAIYGKFNICGERIREARICAGLSQEKLAAKLQLDGISIGQMAISRIESGKRVVADYELVALARALSVTLEWLTQAT